jgi:hypothetical protein
MDTGKSYHKEATGLALETVHKHRDANTDVTLYGSCFCPFVQRAWVTFEHLKVPYKVGFFHFIRFITCKAKCYGFVQYCKFVFLNDAFR